MKLKNLLFTLGFILCFSLQTWADTEPDNNVYTGADPMAENSTVSGTIATPVTDLEDWYQFTTTSDGNITISFTCLPLTSYNRIYLYDSDGTTNLGSAEGYGGATFTKNGLAAGTYYIRYYYYSTSFASAYELSNTVIPTNYANDTEANDTYLTALTNLNENDSVYGHIAHRYNGGTYDEEDW
ncbi:MAG: pre-peptidase C-terminal domain-containing protein, partial [Fimbriimonadaceae bacterium]|nr:pre-peptidase C-terminal domain-containing protein [Chitinophagales bacterium]